MWHVSSRFTTASAICATLESALEQRRPFDKIIVVDDGSTDGTAEVVRSFGDRVTYLHQANAGVSAARNLGIASTEADLIALLDADDLLTPDKNEKQRAAFEQDDELELCTAYTEAFRSEEMTDAQWQADHRRRLGHWDEPMAQVLITWMFRRSLFERVGPFHGTRGEDTDWLIRARDMDAKARLLPDVLARRRIHPTSVTASWTAESYDTLPDMFKRHLERLRAKQQTS